MWAVLSLATFIPASYNDLMKETSHRWSDMVATIFVLLSILAKFFDAKLLNI